MPFDPQVFARTLDRNAGRHGSRGLCATYVRKALEAAGFGPFPHPRTAKRYGPTLLSLGFSTVPRFGYVPVLADIVVIEAITGHTAGHIAGWNGQAWVSDFVQRTLYPGGDYRRAQPDYALYRYV